MANVLVNSRAKFGSTRFLRAIGGIGFISIYFLLLPLPPTNGPPRDHGTFGASQSSLPQYEIVGRRESRSKKPRLIVCGCVKDSQPHLSRLQESVERVTKEFDLVGMYFAENDSQDDTVQILRSWQVVFQVPVVVISEAHVIGERTDILASARNKLWNQIAIHAIKDGDNQVEDQRELYVLMMDMDETNYHLAHVSECLNLPPNWTVCCANQYTFYYDLWALRSSEGDNWMRCDWWNDCGIKTMEFRRQAYRHIPASHEPIVVDSCFGGAALYRYSKHLQGLNLEVYAGNVPNGRGMTRTICEHVPFFEALRRQRQETVTYIQPKMLNDGKKPSEIFGRALLDYWQPIWQRTWEDDDQSTYYELVRETKGFEATRL